MFGFNNMVPYNRSRNQNLFDNFFNEPFPSFPAFFGNEMKTDIKENEKAYTLTAEIPGVEKGDISLNYDGNDLLSVTVNRSEETKEEKEGYLRRERREGSFGREFYLPGVDAKGISAKYENGILTVELPKSGDGPRGRSIDIM